MYTSWSSVNSVLGRCAKERDHCWNCMTLPDTNSDAPASPETTCAGTQDNDQNQDQDPGHTVLHVA